MPLCSAEGRQPSEMQLANAAHFQLINAADLICRNHIMFLKEVEGRKGIITAIHMDIYYNSHNIMYLKVFRFSSCMS